MEWNYGNGSNTLLAWFPLLCLATLFLFLLLKQRQSTDGAKRKQPPSPPAWPIFGNLFELGTVPHTNLYNLRFKYGPVIWLRLGFTNTLVIQSAKAAEQLFKNHDTSFCDRKVPQACTVHNFDKMVAMGRYGSNWRFHRRFITKELLTSKRVSESAVVRRNCIDRMVQFIEDDVAAARARGESGEVVLTHYLFVMAFNLIGNLIFSKDLVNSQSKEGVEFFDAMKNVAMLCGKPNAADLWPFLKRFDLQGIKKNMKQEMGQTIKIVEKFVRERIEERKVIKNERRKDFLDALLDYEGDGKDEPHKFSTQIIFIIIVEMFFGGTETTSATMEWAMTELLRRPESMRRVKEELNRVVGPNRKVEESDIDELPYLRAVVKETTRLHPPLPLLLPRNTLQDTDFIGYFIPKDTQVFVNAWAIGRDPDAWKDPLSFKPERFLGSDVDYKGQNFELLPFGSGRRICVGILLAEQTHHLAIASLLQSFEWELGNDSTPDTIDMKEKMGIAVRKLIPLKAIPKRIIRQI